MINNSQSHGNQLKGSGGGGCIGATGATTGGGSGSGSGSRSLAEINGLTLPKHVLFTSPNPVHIGFQAFIIVAMKPNYDYGQPSPILIAWMISFVKSKASYCPCAVNLARQPVINAWQVKFMNISRYYG